MVHIPISDITYAIWLNAEGGIDGFIWIPFFVVRLWCPKSLACRRLCSQTATTNLQALLSHHDPRRATQKPFTAPLRSRSLQALNSRSPSRSFSARQQHSFNCSPRRVVCRLRSLTHVHKLIPYHRAVVNCLLSSLEQGLCFEQSGKRDSVHLDFGYLGVQLLLFSDTEIFNINKPTSPSHWDLRLQTVLPTNIDSQRQPTPSFYREFLEGDMAAVSAPQAPSALTPPSSSHGQNSWNYSVPAQTEVGPET